MATDAGSDGPIVRVAAHAMLYARPARHLARPSLSTAFACLPSGPW